MFTVTGDGSDGGPGGLEQHSTEQNIRSCPSARTRAVSFLVCCIFGKTRSRDGHGHRGRGRGG